MRHLNGSRRTLWRGAFVAALAMTLLSATAGVASATTGPGYLQRPPKYKISAAAYNPYQGRYLTSSIAPGAKIISAELYLGVAESGYAAGGLSIYYYDAQGQPSTFLANIYNIHQVGNHLASDIVGTGGIPTYGHLNFRRVGRNLVGQIDGPPHGGPYAIAFRYVAAAEPPNNQSPGASQPNVGVVPASQPHLKPGWGPTADFLGRYRLEPTAATPSATASSTSGIFTVAVQAAERLAADSRRPTGGELTLFMRTVKKTEPPFPSGILSVTTPGGNYLLYLTELKSAGTTRAATVNAGGFLGQGIGSFKGASTAPGMLSGDLTIKGVGTLSAHFLRFSKNPKP